MTYGLQLTNSGNSLIFDSNDSLSLFEIHSSSASNSTNASMPSNAGVIWAAPPINYSGSAMLSLYYYEGTQYVYSSATSTNGVKQRILGARAYKGNKGTSTSGYGLEVYGAGGPGVSNNVLLTTNTNTGYLTLYDYGNYGDTSFSSSTNTTITLPASVDPNNVFALISGTYWRDYEEEDNTLLLYGMKFQVYQNYTFNYTGSSKSITINGFERVINQDGQVFSIDAYTATPKTAWALGIYRGD
tara:strand:- start:417 stop:1145 length:729 start_codon:yes stop_codon:yes gene_type:complete